MICSTKIFLEKKHQTILGTQIIPINPELFSYANGGESKEYLRIIPVSITGHLCGQVEPL